MTTASLRAADQILHRDICDLTILGSPQSITDRAQSMGLDISGATWSTRSTRSCATTWPNCCAGCANTGA